MSDRSVDAVTFDYWSTLVGVPRVDRTRARRVRQVGEGLRSIGLERDDERIDAALGEVLATHQEHWIANRQYTYERALADLFERLDVEVDAGTRAAIADDFTGQSSDAVPPLTDNIATTLADLRARDIRIGIICDVGLSPSVVLRRHLDRHGVLDHFDHWSFSDEVGTYKPAPEIFAHALRGLGGIDPGRAAHVGDLKATDVAGARRAGLRSVRYRGDNDDGAADGAEADHVIDDHTELLALLGLD